MRPLSRSTTQRAATAPGRAHLRAASLSRRSVDAAGRRRRAPARASRARRSERGQRRRARRRTSAGRSTRQNAHDCDEAARSRTLRSPGPYNTARWARSSSSTPRRKERQQARRQAPARGRKRSQDGARARRRRLHRRRLRDRRAARARPAVRQPHGQPVRRLRRHERRLLRRRARRQRRHARGDDAGGQPAGADAVPRHRPRHAAAPQLPRVRRQGAACCRSAPSRARARARGQLGQVSVDGRRRSGSPRGCRRALHRRGHRGLRARACSSDPDRTDDFRAARATSCTSRATDLDTCERIVFGADGWDDVPISTRRARLDRAADGLQAGRGQRPRARRRRHRLDDERRHRRRGGREVRRRRQPARPLRQRLRAARPRR